VSTTVFLAGKDNSQVLDGFLDIVADFDLAIHVDKRYGGSNSGGTTVARQATSKQPTICARNRAVFLSLANLIAKVSSL
jgi:hypothetical protein